MKSTIRLVFVKQRLAEAGVARLADQAVMAPVPTRQPGGVSLASWRARRVHLYVEANLDHKLDTTRLARVACASRAHFCRCFKRTFGVTVHQYVRQRRIERAQHLMLTTSATLTEIAATCGMSDHSHLSRVFRRAVEESPSAWRRRNLGWRVAGSTPASLLTGRDIRSRRTGLD